MTDLDDLKIAWKELNRQVDRQNTLTLRQITENKLGRFRSGLRPLIFGQTLQLIVGAMIIVVSADFWLGHLNQLHLLLSGLFLHVYGILFIAFAVRDLILILRIDYSAPIVFIQKQLAELRAWHIRAAIWYGMAGSVAWLPVLIIILHLLGADIWIQKPRVVWWLLTSAFVCLAFNYCLVLLAQSPGKCGRALAGSWIGRSVNRAQAALSEIKEFERELA